MLPWEGFLVGLALVALQGGGACTSTRAGLNNEAKKTREIAER